MYFCKDLIQTLWDIRHKDVTAFKKTDIQYLNQRATVLSRASEVTVFNGDKDGHIAMLTYADQNPLGYSEEANLVRQGYLKTDEVGWLFLVYPDFKKKLWLAKIVRGCSTIIRDCKYSKEESKVWLYPPKKDIYHKVIPISSVPM
jgi:hypothetical protein